MNEINLSKWGIINTGKVFHNLTPSQLTTEAVKRGEGVLSETGALSVMTGKYTGRSPEDRFVVDTPDIHDEIAWGKVNVPISEEKFDKILTRVATYFQGRDVFVFDGFAGADHQYRQSIRVINELASQNMFIHQLLIRPTAEEFENFAEDFTVICAPGCKCIPELDGIHSEAAILVNFNKKVVVIAGSGYAGEMKKSVFSVMNFILPAKGVLSMHCSANMDPDTGDTAVFFGLSGTGKTTLSADPNRMLIGDDEHGWSENGVFNIEGGCYAKCINLSKENEPFIWDAIRFGSLVENVTIDEQGHFDFNDGSVTENTRVGYPVDYIPNAAHPSMGGIPKTVIFLTADAFGVLPPISKLSKEAAMYHFVTGYTAKLAGTERGVTEPTATFSPCFGAPFLPRPASKYAEMLGEKIEKYGTNVYLVNTGWAGGPAGKGGNRMKLKYTRAMVTAALNGELEKSEFVTDPIFNVAVPTTCPNVPSEVLIPRDMWADKAAYDEQAKKLAGMFVKNFAKYEGMDPAIIAAGPKAD